MLSSMSNLQPVWYLKTDFQYMQEASGQFCNEPSGKDLLNVA